jgi:hypothetical protein
MTLQDQLDTYTEAVSQSREAVGTIGDGNSSNAALYDTVELREELMNSLTAEAVTNSIRLSNGSESVVLDRILRIEHQTWIRGVGEDGTECINLLEYDDVELL